MDKQFLIATALAMAVFAPAAMAQKLLPGGVQYNANTEDNTSSLRISRPTILRANTAATQMQLQGQQAQTASWRPLSTGVSAADFSTKTLPQTLPQRMPQIGAPYVWNQSAQGGYWDSSGSTRDVVWADKLYLYGGKFADGTPVGKEPIRDFNAMGHAFRANQTPTTSFWTHF